MIKKLKRKFIVVAMAAVFCVLALLIGLINIINFKSVNKYADDRLDVLAENNGVFPNPGDIMGEGKRPRGDISPEAPFDTRYFTVTIREDGTVRSIDTGRIAAVSTENAAEYALEIYAVGSDGGFIGNYKYTAVDSDGDTMYIFLDCERELGSFLSFLYTSLGISAAGLALVFIFVWILSGVALKPAKESYEKQSRFITDAGHEIKTPLTIIDAAAELIELEGGESQWTRSIKNQVNRLTGLTEKLVLLTRMDEDSGAANKKEFSLSDAVRETAESFEAVAVSREKNLVCHVQDGVSYRGDEALIRQMLSLLLDNAMKYSNTGGHIEAILSDNGKSKRIIIKNTVDHIEKGDHCELFERFYRPDSSRNSETGGHGIGLSVAEAIVRVHGGKISAFSEDGVSVEFTVTL